MNHSGPVRVDGLAIVGAFHGVGHAKVAELESVFLRQHVWFPEHAAAVHVRWTFVLEHVPGMRGRHLYDDLSDVYEAALKLPSSYRLLATYDLSILQGRLWRVLADNGMTMLHAFGWELCAAQAWQRRLLARLEEQRPWRRNNFGKVKRPRSVPDAKTRRWFN